MPQQNTYGVGIVGCGTISGINAEAVRNSKKGKLVAAYSRNQSKLAPFCSRFNVEGYDNWDKFIDNDNIDVVTICTPSGTHLNYGKRVAAAKKHAIVEKPIEVTLERGRELIDECEENGVKLAVIYQNRFIEDVVKMKSVIDNGDIGNIFLVDVQLKWFRDQDYFKSAPWRGTLALDGGGVVINQSIHTLDLTQWLAGDIDTVFAYKGTFTHEGIEGEDNAAVALKLKNGAIGVFHASTSIVPPRDRKIEIHGEKGTALLDGDAFHLLKTEDDTKKVFQEDEAAGAANPLSGLGYDNHRKQYDSIFEALDNNENPPVSSTESLKSLAFVTAIYKSVNENKPVSVDGIFKKFALVSK